jgi:hypothetical protein
MENFQYMPIDTIFFGGDFTSVFSHRKLAQQVAAGSAAAAAASSNAISNSNASMKWKAALWEKDSIEPAMLR